MARKGSSGRSIAPVAAAAVLCAAALGLASLQYLIPTSSRFPGPVYVEGARDYSRFLFGAAPGTLTVRTYVSLFVVAILLMWVSYAVLVYWAYSHGLRHPWRYFAVAAGLALSLAVVFPPSLTHDVFAYLGFARMGPMHGLNPYVTTLQRLALAGDVAAQRYPAPHAAVYGPAWTLLTTAVVVILKGAPLMAQAMAMKVVEAAALAVGALAARVVAEQEMPGAGDVALVAFAFNPLLLVEGPGNGHVDILMMALLVSGLALLARGRTRTGFLVVGLSVAVKFVTLAILPLVILRAVSAHPRARTARGAEAATLALLPLALSSIPYLAGGDPLSAVQWLFGSRANAAGGAIVPVAFLVVSYTAAALWFARAPNDRGRLSAAWVSWSALSLQFALPGTLPWYFAWPIGVAVTAWDRRSIVLSAALMLLGLRWMLSYVVLR